MGVTARPACDLSGGDRDSVGLFQQRPSQGWGTSQQLHTPTYAATAFYTRLLQVPGWQDMALTDAAQAVQRSAYPGAYAQWDRSATVIVAALLGQHIPGCAPQVNAPGNPNAQIAVNAALSQLGIRYSYAGGNRHGPTLGVCQPGADGWNDCHIVGFDCSGLMLYAWGTAEVTVPHDTVAMWNDPAFDHITDTSQLRPGDMMMFEGPPPGHTGIYIGNGQLVDAPHSGSIVKIESDNDVWYAQNYAALCARRCDRRCPPPPGSASGPPRPSNNPPIAPRPTTHDTTGAGTGSPTSGRRVVIPTETPSPAVVDRSPNPGLPAAAVGLRYLRHAAPRHRPASRRLPDL